jgi:hypothetical protein
LRVLARSDALIDLAWIDGPEQQAAIAARGQIGPAAEAALPILRVLARSDDAQLQRLQRAAENALDGIDPDGTRRWAEDRP